MILVGQFDSPFVRRAAVALNFHQIPFERQVLSVFEDFDAMLEINPLGKVPTLILPTGEHLFDSRAIVEYVETLRPSGRTLTPSDPGTYRSMLQVEAVGLGLAEKTYERAIEFARRSEGTHDPVWIARLGSQINSALRWLTDRLSSDGFIDNTFTRADLAVTVALTYMAEKLPQFLEAEAFAPLRAYRERTEARPIFADAAHSTSEALATGWRPESETRGAS